MFCMNRRNFMWSAAGAAAGTFWATAGAKRAAGKEAEKNGGNRKKIRLGVIRADTHAYYYAVMLDKCDPLLPQKYDYVVHHYMSNIYRPDAITAPWVDGFEIVKVYDYDTKQARAFSDTFQGRPVVCENTEQMFEGLDAVFIADCNGGGDHLKSRRVRLDAPLTANGDTSPATAEASPLP